MNVGQVLEIHLGCAAKGLGDQLNKLLEEQKIEVLRKKLGRIFSEDNVKKQIKEFTDGELLDFTDHYRDGLHMATPVFDGAKEDEIKVLLKEAGLSESGQTTLYDGRTEDYLWNDVCHEVTPSRR
jgi:DNA-directed RNA polymerase subunit beta